MYTFGLVIYIIICIALTIVILLQSSKGGGLAGAFGGGGGMGAAFGGRGTATFLSRVTTGLAIAFLTIALFVSFLNRGAVGSGSSLVEQEQQKRSSLPGTGLPVLPPATSSQLVVPTTGDQTSTQPDSSK